MSSVTLSTGVVVQVKTISNVDLFTSLSQLDLVVPQVPIVELDDGREMENPHHPLYSDAVAVFTALKAEKIFEILVEKCVVVADESFLDIRWLELKEYLESQNFIALSPDEKIDFIKYFACKTEDDRNSITEIAVLCEKRVYDFFNAVTITKDGIDINKMRLKHAVQTNISPETIIIGTTQLVNPLDEYTACKDAGLDWVKWIRNEYTLDEKACCIALYRMEKNVDLHSSDAVAEHSERQAKSKAK